MKNRSTGSLNILFHCFLIFIIINIIFFIMALHIQAASTSIAILPFKNASGQYGLEQILFNELSSELLENPDLSLIDRSSRKEMMDEQSLGRTGIIAPQNAIPMGHVSSMDYFLTGNILNVQNILSKTKKNQPAGKFSVFWKLTDTTSGRVLWAGTTSQIIEKKLRKQNGQKVWCLPPGTPALAMTHIAQEISQTINTRLSPGTAEVHIAGIDQGNIYLDAGESAHIRPGQIFNVYQIGKSIRHPVTGKIIGNEHRFLCKILIESVEKELSSGSVLAGSAADLKIGDVAVSK